MTNSYLQCHRDVGAPVQGVDHLVDALDPLVVVDRFPGAVGGHHRPVLRVERLQRLVQRGVDSADALRHGFVLRVVNVEHLQVFLVVLHVLMVTVAFADFDLLLPDRGKRGVISILGKNLLSRLLPALYYPYYNNFRPWRIRHFKYYRYIETHIATSLVLDDVGNVLMHLDKLRRGQQIGPEVVHHFAEDSGQVG